MVSHDRGPAGFVLVKRQFRVTHVFVRQPDGWTLASLHLSHAVPLAAPAS